MAAPFHHDDTRLEPGADPLLRRTGFYVEATEAGDTAVLRLAGELDTATPASCGWRWPLNVLVGVPVAVFDRVVTTARQVVERTILRKAG